MRYRRLGDSGLADSVVGLGCNNVGSRMPDDAVGPVVDACLEAGVTLFDTADVYGDHPGRSEELLGRAPAWRRYLHRAGATRPEQVRANAAAGAWQPTPQDLADLDAATAPGGGAA